MRFGFEYFPVSRLRRSVRFLLLLLPSLGISACDAAGRSDREVPTLPTRERWTLRFDQNDVAADFDDVFLLDTIVLTVESSTAQISAFETDSGHQLWKRGQRGAGPGEYLEPKQLFGYSPNLVGVVDTRQGRITLLRGDGTTDRLITGERATGDLTNVCGSNDGTILAVRLPQFEIVRIDEQPEATVLYRLGWPVPIYNETPLLQQGLFARSREGDCVVYQPRGDFFFSVVGDSLPTDRFHRYSQPYPAQTLDRTKQYPQISPGGVAAAYAVVKADSLFVLRGGITKGDKGRVDVYLLQTGERVAQFTLPPQTYKFDVEGDRLIVLQSTESGSLLTLYQR